jgi:hypothetical protein
MRLKEDIRLTKGIYLDSVLFCYTYTSFNILSRVGWYARLIRRVIVRMIGFYALWLQSLLITFKYRQYSAIADLHTFQLTVAQALGFSVFTSRILATDLNTEIITVSLNHTLQELHLN